MDTFAAAASIYQCLFNRLTIPIEDGVTMHFDEMASDVEYLKTYENSGNTVQSILKQYNLSPYYNILATIDVIFMVGWKYHESQQKAKTPKMRDLSLREVSQTLMSYLYRLLKRSKSKREKARSNLAL